jgi:hypothetical protein
MNYEQFIQFQILWHERLLDNIKAGKLGWCEDCESWVPVEELRPNPLGGDWPVCIDCLADSGLEDSLVTEEEYNECLADSEREAAERTTDEEAQQC